MFSLMKDHVARRDEALPGREEALPITNRHFVLGTPLRDAFIGKERVQFGMGCFWGAEKKFWSLPGIATTAVGYAGGHTPNANYKEVCTGLTGHTEVVLVVYDPKLLSFEQLLKVFWESHDPTQGFRQGNDVGTQYRSAIFTHGPAQLAAATASRDMYQRELAASGYGEIRTEIREAPEFYFAEDYHQGYLVKVPNGYCPNHSTGVKLPDDFAVTPLQLVD